MQQLTFIPKIVHQIVGQRQSRVISDCLASWSHAQKDGYEVRIWTDQSIMEFLAENHKFAFSAFVDARNHAEAADIARYLIVYTFGGYYADWDVKLLDVNKFTLLSETYPNGYMLVDPSNDTISSEYFCAQPKDEFLLNLVIDIVDLYESNQRDSIGTPQYSGPYRMRDSLKAHPITKIVPVAVKDVFVYDYTEIRDFPEKVIDRPLIHYWTHSWF